MRDEPAEVKKKIRGMTTDPARVRRTDPGDPEKCPVWQFHKVYSDEATQDWVVKGCTSAGIGCLDCKQPVIDAIVRSSNPGASAPRPTGQPEEGALDRRDGHRARAHRGPQTMKDGHPQPGKYPRQKIMVVEFAGYAYLVPFVEEEDHFFLIDLSVIHDNRNCSHAL